MEEVHHEKVRDYMQSLQGLGSEQFLATYRHPFLLAHYLAQTFKADTLITGVCQTVCCGYPDGREWFIKAMKASQDM